MSALPIPVIDRGDRFVERWRGADFTWNGRTREEGVDCYGLVVAFAREVLGVEMLDWRRADHSRAWTRALMTRQAVAMPRLDRPRDGRLVIVRRGGEEAHHLGVCWRGRVLHAAEGRGVVLDRYAEFARAHPVHHFAVIAP